MGEPVDAYFRYVNEQQVPEVFEPLEEAKVAAKPYAESGNASDQDNLGPGPHLEL